MRILVPTAGANAARETADYIMRIALRLSADVIALHVERDDESAGEAIGGPLVLTEAGRSAGVKTLPVTKSGELINSIVEAIDEFSVDLIVMGVNRGAVVKEWLSVDVKDVSHVPVLVVPHVLISEFRETGDDQ